MGLSKYKQKRNFTDTPEPEGKAIKGKGALKFVIQRHAATRLHYDFRLEMEGVLKSWAVPKGPSLNPSDKRLAMMVEDHPLSYRTFEGVIPEGNYGAGVVEIWDEGTYEHIEDKNRKTGEKKLLTDLQKGSIKIVMHGKKLKGEFALIKIKGGEDNAWLLIKHKDEFSTSKPYDAEKFADKNSAVTKALEAKAAKKSIRRKITVAEKKTSAKEETKQTKPAVKKNYVAEPAEKKFHDFIVPMMAKLGDKPFSSADWLFEIKWDGYRAIAEAGKKPVRLYSRNGLSFADKYRSVYEELQNIKDEMILDGEIVVLNEQGRPDFQALQNYDQSQHLPIVYYVFDILKYKGKSVTNLPLTERKELLKKVLPESEIIRYCDHVEKEGELFFQKIQELNVEGMIAKRKDSIYAVGKRTGDWLKVKHHNIEEVVIAGYTEPRGGRKFFGALVLGRYEGKELKYAGHTGTGFDDKSLKDLYHKLQPLVTDKSPFKSKTKTNMPVTWVKPVLVCNIKFTELTSEKIFRHPVFMGLRVDKKATEVKADDMPAKTTAKKTEKKAEIKKATAKSQAVKEDDLQETETGTKIVTIDGKELKFTNRNKIYYPDEGYTKGDVIDYYNQVHKFILPYLKDRPESLRRNPNGIKGSSFFQKDAGGQAPDWVKSIVLYSEGAKKNIDYILCNDRATLLYLANLGCIEINPWNSRVGKLEYPDYIVMDLDPSDNNTFEEVIDAALATKEVLDKAGAVGYCKTSGANGMHIYIPMGAKYTYDQARDFCKLIAMQVQDMLPDTTTLERSLNKRSDKKIYLDALQNKQGQTLSSVYSLRPKPGATVSAPLDWKEVKHGLHPSQFHIKNIIERIEKKGDLFKGVLGKGVDMMKCLKKLQV